MLEYLDAERFTFNRWLPTGSQVPGEAGLEATCHAICFGSEKRPRISVYCKIFRLDHAGICNLINEIVGHQLAIHFQLPVATAAFVLNIPLKKLDLETLPKIHDWLKSEKRKNKNGSCIAFATQDMKAFNGLSFYGKNANPNLIQDIAIWPLLSKSVIFDEVITNNDRNLGNLLRRGKGDYILIDHGRLINESGIWRSADLEPEMRPENVLLNIRDAFPSMIKISDNDLIATAEKHFINNSPNTGKLSGLSVLNALCEMHPDKTKPKTLEEFFCIRAKNSDRIMQHRLKTLT